MWPQGAESCETRHVERTFRRIGPPAQGKLPADDFPVIAINDGYQMPPAVFPTVDMRGIERPAFIAPRGDAFLTAHAWLRCCWTLPDHPPLLPHEPPHFLAIDQPLVAKAQPSPNTAVPIGGMELNEFVDARK